MTTIAERHDPTFSVVVALYNGERYIIDCLKSILNQTYEDFEVLVVDDGSTDKGPILVEAIASSAVDRVFVLRHADGNNHGIAATRNVGIKKARGKYLTFIDQDDLWMPGKLEEQFAVLQNYPGVALTYGKIDFVDCEGNQVALDGFRASGKGKGNVPTNMFREILQENVVPSITVAVRRTAIPDEGFFPAGPKYAFEDWLAWTKLAYKYDFLFVDKVLARRRIHKDNYSAVRLASGEEFDAELHFVKEICSYLLSSESNSTERVKHLVPSRLTRFLIRARSWGVPSSRLAAYAGDLIAAFPEEAPAIRRAKFFMPLLPLRVAHLLRRVRRRLVRI